MSNDLSRGNRPKTSATGANFRASEGDERRGYGLARGAKKRPVNSPEYEKTDATDKVFWNNTLNPPETGP